MRVGGSGVVVGVGRRGRRRRSDRARGGRPERTTRADGKTRAILLSAFRRVRFVPRAQTFRSIVATPTPSPHHKPPDTVFSYPPHRPSVAVCAFVAGGTVANALHRPRGRHVGGKDTEKGYRR